MVVLLKNASTVVVFPPSYFFFTPSPTGAAHVIASHC